MILTPASVLIFANSLYSIFLLIAKTTVDHYQKPWRTFCFPCKSRQRGYSNTISSHRVWLKQSCAAEERFIWVQWLIINSTSHPSYFNTSLVEDSDFLGAFVKKNTAGIFICFSPICFKPWSLWDANNLNRWGRKTVFFTGKPWWCMWDTITNSFKIQGTSESYWWPQTLRVWQVGFDCSIQRPHLYNQTKQFNTSSVKGKKKKNSQQTLCTWKFIYNANRFLKKYHRRLTMSEFCCVTDDSHYSLFTSHSFSFISSLRRNKLMFPHVLFKRLSSL